MSGQRGANKAVFESDLLICLGTHLSIPHTTTLYKNYAPNSKKIIVNILFEQKIAGISLIVMSFSDAMASRF